VGLRGSADPDLILTRREEAHIRLRAVRRLSSFGAAELASSARCSPAGRRTVSHCPSKSTAAGTSLDPAEEMAARKRSCHTQ